MIKKTTFFSFSHCHRLHFLLLPEYIYFTFGCHLASLQNEITFLNLDSILNPATVAMAALTRQGALRLLQVEDLVEGSLLGAVGAASLLLPVYSARDGGKAAPGNHWLDLRGRRG